MAKEWKATCKDCGIEFGYSDTSHQLSRARGLSRPERCPKCRLQHSREIRTLGLSHYELKPFRPIAPDQELQPGLLGKLDRQQRVHRWQDISKNFDFNQFGITNNDIRQLFALLRQHQVAVVVGPTGSGKSTFLPYRLMIPPEGEAPDTFTRYGQIIVTQPRIQATRNIPQFVARDLHGSSLGAGFDVGFRHSNMPATDWRNKLVYVTDGTLINWLVTDQIGKFSVIMIDEAHERSLNIDLILGLLKAQLSRYPHLKLIVASATIDADRFVNYYGGAENVGYIEFQGKRQFGYETRFRQEKPIPPHQWSAQMPQLVAKKVFEILQAIAAGEEDEGDILGFLHGERPIEDACRRIREYVEEDARLVGKVDILPLYTKLPQSEQDKALRKKRDTKRRRVVISTNVAETSLTVDGIVHVVESGLINESNWDSDTQTTILTPKVHSQAGCKQRWGRAGRIQHGVVHCLYTEEQFNDPAIFSPYTLPEIKRAPLEQIILTAKVAGVDDIFNFDWIEPPSFEELQRSRRSLMHRGALDVEGDLTEHGLELQSFMDAPDIANLMVLADQFTCGVEMATLLAMMKAGGRRTLLRWNRNWDAITKRAVNRIHQGLISPCQDDIEFYLKIYEAWAGNPKDNNHQPAKWAAANYINHSVLKNKVQAERDQLLQPLTGHKKYDERRRLNFDLLMRLRIVLVYGLPDRVYLLDDAPQSATSPSQFLYRPFLANQGGSEQSSTESSSVRVEIDPESVCQGKTLEAFACLQKRMTRRRLSPLAEPEKVIHASTLTLIEPEWLSCLGKSLFALVRLIAQKTRNETGDLILTADRARLFLDQAYPIGGLFNGQRLDGTDYEQPLVLLERQLESAPSVIEVERDEEAEVAPDVEEEDVGTELAELSEADEEDLIVLTVEDEGETTSLIEDLLEEEESENDWLTDSFASGSGYPLTSLTNEAGQTLQVIGRLKLREQQSVPHGSFAVQVECFDFSDLTHPTVEVHLPHSTDPFQRFVTEHKEGEEVEVTVKAIEKYSNDYLTYLLVEHPETGLEIIMEPEDVSLIGRNFAVERLHPGNTFKVVIERIDLKRQRIHISRLPTADKDFQQFLKRMRGQHEVVLDGQIVEVRYNGLYVLLELPDENMNEPIAAFASIEYLPTRPELTVLGKKCRVKVPLFNNQKPRSRQLPFLPDGLVELLSRRTWGDHITANLETRQLRVVGRMSYYERSTLLTQSANPEYRRTVNWLYRRSNSLMAEVVDIEALQMLEEAQQRNERHKGKIIKIMERSVLVELDSGVTGIVRAEEVWSAAMENVGEDQEVEVLVKNVDLDLARVELSMKLPENDPWHKYGEGIIAIGRVTELQPSGAFVELEPDVAGLIPCDELSWTRVIRVEQVVNVDERVTVKIIKKDDSQRQMAFSCRLEEQKPHIRFPVDSWHKGTVINIQDYGVFIEIARGVTGLARSNQLSYDHFNHPSDIFCKGQSVQSRVIDIKSNESFYEIELSCKAPDANPYCQYQPGQCLEGTVSDVSDRGVLVRLDAGGIGWVPLQELSWVPFRYPQDVASIGSRLQGMVIAVDADAEELIVSKKALEANPFSRYQVGMQVQCRVIGIEDYGAFVEIEPGVSGLIYRDELSWTRARRVEEVVQIDDLVAAQIININEAKRELNFSCRLESERPEVRFPLGSWHDGTVVNLLDYGAFIAIAKGVTGLVPKGELSYDYVSHPSQIVFKGQPVRVQVINIQMRDGIYQIALRLKDNAANPYQRYYPGLQLSGVIYDIRERDGVWVQLDSGGKGIIPIRELSWARFDHPGDVVSINTNLRVEVVSVNAQKEELRLSKKALEPNPISYYSPGLRLEGMVCGVQDNGALVNLYSGGTGFISNKELSWEFVNHPHDVVCEGMSVTVEVLSVDLPNNKLFLTMKFPETHWINKYREGETLYATVSTIKNFGVFVDLPYGGSGLVHISELSWRRVQHPIEVVGGGERVEVLIKEIDQSQKQINLSMKALQAKPQLSIGQTVWGTVTKIESYGAFVDIEEYASGLIHISELACGYVSHPSTVVSVGQQVKVKVIQIEPKIRLSLKQAS